MSVLGHLTCNAPEALNRMLYPASSDDGKMVSFMGHRIEKISLPMARPRICPQCLKEKNYIRQMWDLGLVTCCPVHNCMLIDSCPQCGKRLTWYRDRVSGCVDSDHCRYDFTQMTTHPVPEKETYLARQIYHLLGIADMHSPFDRDNPVKGLSLNALMHMACYFARKYGLEKPAGGMRQFTTTTSIYQRHRALAAISPILCDWPDGFYQLLDRFRSQQHDSRHKFGFYHEFGKNNFEGLKRNLFDGEFLFVPQALEQYLQNWDGGYITRRNQWISNPNIQKDMVGLEQARGLLGMENTSINKLIELGTLKAKVIKSGNRRMVLIDRDSIKQYQKEQSKWVSVKDAAAHLAVTETFIYKMLRAKILGGYTGPDIAGFRNHRFGSEEISNLLHGFFKAFFHHGYKQKSNHMICFYKAINILRHKMYSGVQFIQMVLSAQIYPVAIVEGQGLGCFLFDEEQIRNIHNLKQERFEPGKLSLKQASRKLELSYDGVHYLTRAGFLETELPHGSRRLLLIPEESIESFKKRYTVAYKLASDLGIHTHRLSYLLEQLGVKKVKARKTVSRAIVLYHKKDIDRIDLRHLTKGK